MRRAFRSAPPDALVRVPTPTGSMAAILARPETGGPAPAVIMFPHVGGLTATMHLMAQRAAAGGLLCLVPDPYHRLGTLVLDPESEDPEAVAIQRAAAASVTGERIVEDTRAALDWLAALPEARPGPRGTIGYGRGGGWALLAAAAFPDEIAAAASVLGFGFVTDAPGSPHRRFAQLRAKVYAAFAGRDAVIPGRTLDDLREALRSAPAAHEFVVHPGAQHPYAFPDRAVYDAAAAEADWRRIFGLFERRIGGR